MKRYAGHFVIGLVSGFVITLSYIFLTSKDGPTSGIQTDLKPVALRQSGRRTDDPILVSIPPPRKEQKAAEGAGAVLPEAETEQIEEVEEVKEEETEAEFEQLAEVDTTQTNQQPALQPTHKHKSKIHFVFVVGIEGTGHHFMNSILKQSPIKKTFEEIGQIGNLANLSHILHNRKDPQHSLLNSHCESTNATINLADTMSRAAKQFQVIEQATRRKLPNRKKPLHVALNTMLTEDGKSGMMSYPNFKGACRANNYPSLELLYMACDMAAVDCGHIYIYRDPNAVIHSTTKRRKFSASMTEQLHLYNTMYKVVESQLYEFQDRTWGCVDLYEIGNGEGLPGWADEFRQLWGWQSLEDFATAMASIYRAPKPVRGDAIPERLEPYKRLIYRAHNKVLDLCKKTQSSDV